MPNEAEVFGLPKVLINFRTKSTTAIARSARGIVVMILKNEEANKSNFFKINDSTDIPDTGLTPENVDLIKKALLGSPLRVLVYTLPKDGTDVGGADSLLNQDDILRDIAHVKWNYICHPTGTAQEQEDLATWVKTQRNIKRKTFKAIVANVKTADDKGVINLTTDKIRVENPAYEDALTAAGGDASKVPSSIPQFTLYTAVQYTARIAGILAGLPLDRSATYYELAEVVDCETYDDIDAHINNGELCLFDELDGNGVKIARMQLAAHLYDGCRTGLPLY